MSDQSPSVNVREVVLKRIRWRHTQRLSDELVDHMRPEALEILADHIIGGWTVAAEWSIPGKEWTERDYASVPDGWWQAFKVEVMPKWLRRLFKQPRMRRIVNATRITKVAPMLGVQWNGGYSHFFEAPHSYARFWDS